MQSVPKVIMIGTKSYKTRRLAGDYYSLWQYVDISSLKYLGEWTKQQLIKCCERGELV